MAAQYQSLYTKNYPINIIRNVVDLISRLCEQHLSSSNQLVSCCAPLSTEGNHWHDASFGEENWHKISSICALCHV